MHVEPNKHILKYVSKFWVRTRLPVSFSGHHIYADKQTTASVVAAQTVPDHSPVAITIVRQ